MSCLFRVLDFDIRLMILIVAAGRLQLVQRNTLLRKRLASAYYLQIEEFFL